MSDERLRAVEAKVDTLIAKLDSYAEMRDELVEKFQSYIDEIKEENEKHNHILYGNGKTGLIVTVDRLVQSEKGRQKTFYMAAAAAIGVVVKVAWDVLSGKG